MGQLTDSGAIFLSASVPDPSAEHFVAEGDASAISAAISALLYVTLGRRRLVWGGHPAITPMVWAVAEAMGVDYGHWVTLYQSRFFEDEFPAETERFKNVVFTDAVNGNRDASLALMRTRMLDETDYYAAVFIGGMRGVVDEYELLKKSERPIRIVPILSTGGVTQIIGEREGSDPALGLELDYLALLHDQLGISPNERRYATPEDQPVEVADRIERFEKKPD